MMLEEGISEKEEVKRVRLLSPWGAFPFDALVPSKVLLVLEREVTKIY